MGSPLLRRRRHGFTLIELLVVIVILALLMGIAIPAYLGQQDKAKDVAAKSDLTIAYRSARAEAVGRDSFPSAVELSALIAEDNPGLSVMVGSASDADAKDKVVIDDDRSTSQIVFFYGGTADHTTWQLSGPLSGAVTLNPAAAYSLEVIADNPLAYWRMEETAGTTMADEMGAHPGTYQNGPPLGEDGALESEESKAVRFDGFDDFVTVPTLNNNTWYTGGFTMEAWAKIDDPSVKDQPLMGSWVGTNNGGPMLWINFFAPGNWSLTTQMGFATYLNSAQAIPADSWEHVVGTWDGVDTYKLYVNGVLEETKTQAFIGQGAHFEIARYDTSSAQYLEGTLDEVAIYDHPLTQQQVLDHFNAAQ